MQTLSLLQYVLFTGVIGLEAYLRLRHDMKEYKVKDTLANISIAVSSLIAAIFLKGTILIVLVKLQSFSLFEAGTSLFTCVCLFFLSDLIHYAIHYLEHKSRFFWAVHSVHHSSESYNFSVALRTAHTNCMYKFFYEAPLCLLGFDAYQVVMIHNIILFFGFFQHTELVGKLGWLEYVLNTPSHHRVHHASNEKYLDKNFGGVLIIWDKLFGTFQPEVEKPTYGLTQPIKTYNPFKIILNEWMAITKDVLKSGSWKERMSYVFYKPGWKAPEDKRSPAVQPAKKKVCTKCAACSLTCRNKFKENFHSPILITN
jgi:sterol desaturase/sphingolipid hydroxylase (fatty acid hydroxylase superfamily)